MEPYTFFDKPAKLFSFCHDYVMQTTDPPVTVTVVDRLESIKNVSRLSPKDGLVLQSGDRIGVVLPWEGKDPKVRLEWAYRKAGVKQGERVNLHLMVAERYRG